MTRASVRLSPLAVPLATAHRVTTLTPQERATARLIESLEELPTADRAEIVSRLGGTTSSKAAAILAGAAPSERPDALKSYGDNYKDEPFLAKIADARRGDPEANAWVKAVLGTSDATGQALIPNNFVASLAEQARAKNIFRQLMTVNTGVRSAAVDIPYELTAVTAALVQGAYGSNKDVRDYSFGQATATLYTIAQIADIGNQLLRQSGGIAEANARRRLGDSIGLAESAFIVSGTGSSQPLGILQAILAFGDIAATKYTLNTESRVAAIGNAIAKLDARGVTATAVVLNPTDRWEMNVETLGTSGAGGWAFDPSSGPQLAPLAQAVWGVPVVSCADLPSGTGLVADWTAFDIFLGNDFRIDVSSEAGSRFDQNITGFRAEEDFGFNAEPGVRTLKVVKILGL